MGAPGGAFYMGQAFNMLASGMKEAFSTFEKFGPHKGLPTVKDIPFLLKAIRMRDADVAGEAQRALVWLTGVDLGLDAKAWKQWWKENGPRLAREERERTKAANAFAQFKCNVLTGRWDAAAKSMSARLLSKVDVDELANFLRKNSRVLRQVYRDAKTAKIEVSGYGAELAIDWGEAGFEFAILQLVREGGGWKFDRFPWGRKVTRSWPRRSEEPKETDAESKSDGGRSALVERNRHCQKSARAGRRRARDISRVILLILALIGGGWGFLWLAVQSDTVATLGGWLLAVVVFGSVPGSLLYCMLFGRLKRSREIRDEIRPLGSTYSPHARARR